MIFNLQLIGSRRRVSPDVWKQYEPTEAVLESEMTRLSIEVFSANYTDVAKQRKKNKDATYANDNDPYARAARYGEKAMASVNDAVGAANDGLQAARDMMARMMALRPWDEIDKAGMRSQEAGRETVEASVDARPYIYSQIGAHSATPHVA